MTSQEFDYICLKAVEKVREIAPFDTGNLRNDSIQFYKKNENTFVIEVNEDIAPYMPCTNEPWESPKWHGKKNPNQNWWESATKAVADMIANEIYNGATVNENGEQK